MFATVRHSAWLLYFIVYQHKISHPPKSFTPAVCPVLPLLELPKRDCCETQGRVKCSGRGLGEWTCWTQRWRYGSKTVPFRYVVMFEVPAVNFPGFFFDEDASSTIGTCSFWTMELDSYILGLWFRVITVHTRSLPTSWDRFHCSWRRSPQFNGDFRSNEDHPCSGRSGINQYQCLPISMPTTSHTDWNIGGGHKWQDSTENWCLGMSQKIRTKKEIMA